MKSLNGFVGTNPVVYFCSQCRKDCTETDHPFKFMGKFFGGLALWGILGGYPIDVYRTGGEFNPLYHKELLGERHAKKKELERILEQEKRALKQRLEEYADENKDGLEDYEKVRFCEKMRISDWDEISEAGLEDLQKWEKEFRKKYQEIKTSSSE